MDTYLLKHHGSRTLKKTNAKAGHGIWIRNKKNWIQKGDYDRDSGIPTLPEEGSPEPHRASRGQTGRSSPPVQKLMLINDIPYQGHGD